MSIAAALASYAAQQQQLIPKSSPSALPTIHETSLEGSAIEDDDDDVHPPHLSLSASSSSLASTTASQSIDVPSLHQEPSPRVDVDASSSRHNQHLAVLLPKQLWKPDAGTTHCDVFHCHKSFSLFERKHHCRKCGGIFCSECSSRTTLLLDTTHLDFLYPPRGVPLSTFHSALSPLAPARVCDDCYDQVHGCRVPRSPRITRSPSSSSLRSTVSESAATKSTRSRPSVRRTHTAPSISRSRRSSRNSSPEKPTLQTPPPELAFGELESYPLKQHSSICKANGGGRWQPKPAPVWDGYRVPGGKARFEIMMEQKEAAQRLRKSNPIIRDGDFQLRAPREFDPIETTRPFVFATF